MSCPPLPARSPQQPAVAHRTSAPARWLLRGVCLVAVPLSASAADPSTLPRVALSDLVYVGSFRLPTSNLGSLPYATFDYAGVGCAFDATRQGLYLMGHVYGQLTAEVSIPTPIAIINGNVAAAPFASVLQPFGDLTNGHRNDDDVANGVSVSGLLLVGSSVLGTVNGNYDAGGQQVCTHFVGSPTLSTPTCTGLVPVGPAGSQPRMLAGYMAPVPAAWQAALGGPVLTGSGGGNIISGTSSGPSAWTFDPARMGVVTPVPATPLVYYPLSHPTLGAWGAAGANPVYDMCTCIEGCIFPAGTRTVLFFGRTGLGVQAYGEGTADPSLDGTIGADGELQCYDPVDSSKGCHAYPYAAYLWAYDANDLAQVASGTLQPWQVTPYATGVLPLPVDAGQNLLCGAAYDPATGRVFVAQQDADTVDPYSARTLVHVFQLPAYDQGSTGTATSSGTGSGGGTAGGTGATGTGATSSGGGQGHCGLGGGAALLLAGLWQWRRQRGRRAA